MGSKLYTRGERIFKWVSLVLLLVICVATLAPFVLILASSLTDETTLITYGYSFWPQKFSMDSYLYMWNQRKQIGRSYLTSLGITAVGTVVSLLFTTMLAYPMSRKDFKYSNQLSFFVFFTMLFNGGNQRGFIRQGACQTQHKGGQRCHADLKQQHKRYPFENAFAAGI